MLISWRVFLEGFQSSVEADGKQAVEAALFLRSIPQVVPPPGQVGS